MAVAGLALYVAFLLVAPFEHHDLSCELKTPQHCTACSASVPGADPHDEVIPSLWHFVHAGDAAPADVTADSVLLAVRTTGRSPPAAL